MVTAIQTHDQVENNHKSSFVTYILSTKWDISHLRSASHLPMARNATSRVAAPTHAKMYLLLHSSTLSGLYSKCSAYADSWPMSHLIKLVSIPAKMRKIMDGCLIGGCSVSIESKLFFTNDYWVEARWSADFVVPMFSTYTTGRWCVLSVSTSYRPKRVHS